MIITLESDYLLGKNRRISYIIVNNKYHFSLFIYLPPVIFTTLFVACHGYQTRHTYFLYLRQKCHKPFLHKVTFNLKSYGIRLWDAAFVIGYLVDKFHCYAFLTKDVLLESIIHVLEKAWRINEAVCYLVWLTGNCNGNRLC